MTGSLDVSCETRGGSCAKWAPHPCSEGSQAPRSGSCVHTDSTALHQTIFSSFDVKIKEIHLLLPIVPHSKNFFV